MNTAGLAIDSDHHLPAPSCEGPDYTRASGTSDEVLSSSRQLPHPNIGERSLPISIQGSRQAVHTCPFCCSEFIRYLTLKSYLLTGPNEKRYECGNCRRIFSHPRDLTRHAFDTYRGHASICSICGRRFGSTDDLERHQDRREGGSCRVSVGSFDEIVPARISRNGSSQALLVNDGTYEEPSEQRSSNFLFDGCKDQFTEGRLRPLYTSKDEEFTDKFDFLRYPQNYSMARFLSAFDPFSRSVLMLQPSEQPKAASVQQNNFHVLKFARSLKEDRSKVREKEPRDTNLYSSGSEDLFSDARKGREWVDEDPPDTISSASVRQGPRKQEDVNGTDAFGDEDSSFAPVDDWLNRTYRHGHERDLYYSTRNPETSSNLALFNDDWITGIPEVSDYFVKNLPVEWSYPAEQGRLEPAHLRELDPSPYHAGSRPEWQGFHNATSANLKVSARPIDPNKREKVLELLYGYQAAVNTQRGLSPTPFDTQTHLSIESSSAGILAMSPNVSAGNSTGQSNSVAKPLNSVLKARKALMRHLGACAGDCRVRRVKCKLHHHALGDLIDRKRVTQDDRALVDWAMTFDSSSAAQSLQVKSPSLFGHKSATPGAATIAATVKNEEENARLRKSALACGADSAILLKLESVVSTSEDEISLLDDETVWSDSESESDAEARQEFRNPLINSVQQTLVNEIMPEILVLLEKNWSRNFTTCAGHSETPSKPGWASGEKARSNPGAPQKRYRDDDDGSPSRKNDDEREPKRPARGPPPPEGPEEVLKLACPFHKHDKRKYGVGEFKICKESHWPDVGRLKGHIYRKHRLPIHCPRCKRLFKSIEERDFHFNVESCDPRPKIIFNGISPAIEDKLRRKHLPYVGQSQPDRWRDIYKLLFPDDIVVPSPYFDPDEEDESYEAYCRQQLPRVFKRNLENLLGSELEYLKRIMIGRADEIMKTCMDEISENYNLLQSTPLLQSTQTDIPIRTATAATLPEEPPGQKSDFLDVLPPPTPPSTSSFPRQNAFDSNFLPQTAPPPVPASEILYLSDSECGAALDMAEYDYPLDNDDNSDIGAFFWGINE